MTDITFMQVHTLKCLAPYFDAIKRGEKTFEIRRDDRGYQKGDFLKLHRQETPLDHLLGIEFIYVEVLYVLTGGQFGLEPGFVAMAIEQREQPDD